MNFHRIFVFPKRNEAEEKKCILFFWKGPCTTLTYDFESSGEGELKKRVTVFHSILPRLAVFVFFPFFFHSPWERR